MPPLPPGVVFDPLDPAFTKNPYPVYAALREHDPVHRSPLGPWVLTRYDDVLDVLRDPRFSNAPAPHAVVAERNRQRYLCADVAHHIVPFMDPPRQTAARRRLSEAFRAGLRSRPPDLDGIVGRLLEAARERGELDVVGELGRPLSRAAIGHLMGVPECDREQLAAWSGMFFYLFVPIPSREILDRMEEALGLFRDYFRRLLEERRRAPGDDVVSALARARPAGGVDSPDAIADACMLLYADGVENVDSAIGNAVISLVDHPAQLRRLREEPGLVPRAADECLRFDPPNQFIARIARETCELHGRTLRAGEAVLLVLAAANRDPAHFEAPDELDVARAGSPHLAFGRGRHVCVGAKLVRMQMAAALTGVAQRLRGLELRDPRIRRVPRFGHRWLESLPVLFEPF